LLPRSKTDPAAYTATCSTNRGGKIGAELYRSVEDIAPLLDPGSVKIAQGRRHDGFAPLAGEAATNATTRGSWKCCSNSRKK
jgi:hypothetical protein